MVVVGKLLLPVPASVADVRELRCLVPEAHKTRPHQVNLLEASPTVSVVNQRSADMPIMPRARRRRVQARAKRHLANAGAALAYHEGFAGDYSTFVVANEDGPGIGIDLTANYGFVLL